MNTPPNSESSDVAYREFMAPIEALRKRFKLGERLSDEELTKIQSFAYGSERRLIGDKMRESRLLKNLAEVPSEDLLWLSDRAGLSEVEKKAISSLISGSKLSSQRERQASSLSSLPSAQNDKAAEVPPNIYRQR